MSLYDRLKKKSGDIAKGVWAQANFRDGGKTYDTTVNNRQVGYRQEPQPQPTQSRMSVGVARPQPQVQVQQPRPVQQRVSVAPSIKSRPVDSVAGFKIRQAPLVNDPTRLRTALDEIDKYPEDEQIRILNRSARSGVLPKNVAAAHIGNALQPNMYKKPSTISQFGNAVANVVTPGLDSLARTAGTNMAAGRVFDMENKGGLKAGQAKQVLNEQYGKSGMNLDMKSADAWRTGTAQAVAGATNLAGNLSGLRTAKSIAALRNPAAQTLKQGFKSAAKTGLGYGVPSGIAESIGDPNASLGDYARNITKNVAVNSALPTAAVGVKGAMALPRLIRGSTVPIYTKYNVHTKSDGTTKLRQPPRQVWENAKGNIRKLIDWEKAQGQGGFVRNPLVNADGTPKIGKNKPNPLEQEAIKFSSPKDLAKSLYDRVQRFDKSIKLSKAQKDDLHQYVQFKMQDRANKPPEWVTEAFNGAQAKNAQRIQAQASNPTKQFKKNMRNAHQVASGMRENAQVKPSQDLPIDYTAQVHDRLLNIKRDPSDKLSRQYIDRLGHVKTLSAPDTVITKSPRDVQYISKGVIDDRLGRVSIKPIQRKGQSYINTAHVVGGGRRSNKVLSAGSADPASPIGGRAENNSTLKSNPIVPTNSTIVNPTAQAIEGAGVPKKLKTVFDSDKALQSIRKEKQDIVRALGAELRSETNDDLFKRVLQQGGISSSAYETMPSGLKRKTGMSADKMAQVLGYDSEDALVEALNNRRKLTVGQAEAEAENLLENTNHPYSREYNAALNREKARIDELQQYPVTARVTDRPNGKMDNAEWQSLAATAPTQPKTAKQAVGQELATTRAELAANKQRMAELQAQQRNEVIQGKINSAAELRQKNAPQYAEIKKLQAKERELAKKYAAASGASDTPIPKDVSEEKLNELYTSTLKDKGKKATFKRLSSEYLGDVEAAKITADKMALDFSNKHKLTKEQHIEAIRASDDPTYVVKDKSVKDAVDDVHRSYDELFQYFTKEKGVDMGYQHDYYPRQYVNTKTGDSITAAEYNLLQKASGRQKGRVSDGLADWKLKYTDPAEGLKAYYNSLERAAAGRKYIQALEQNGLVVKSAGESVRGMRPIVAEGIQPTDGVYYAKKEVADKLNTMFGSQEATGFVARAMEAGQGLNSFWQSVVLSGGVPNTPINAFGFMQVMKEGMALHPIKAAKAMLGGMSKDFSQKYFTKHADIMSLMAKEGISTRYSLSDGAKKGVGRTKQAWDESKWKGINKAWDEITNDATFGRFMPMLQVEHFKNIYKHGIKKGLSPERAAKIAGNSTKNFYGITDLYRTTTRSKLTSDAAGALLFAPRFRESMVNFWGKNAQLLDPRGGFKNIRSKEYRDNLKFMVAAGITYAAYDTLNKELNGTHLWENPEGKEDKLLIPGVDPGGKTLGIPFLPSIATVPRNAGMAVYNAAMGNFDEAGKNVASFFSMPVRTIGELATNENYFGAKIYDPDASAPEKLAQSGSHLLKSTMQPWVREGLNLAGKPLPDEAKKYLGVKDKSALETAANTLEAPVRFYDPKYFKGGGDNFMTYTGKTVGERKAAGSVESIEKASEQRTEALKNTLSYDDYKIYNMSKAEKEEVIKAGIKTRDEMQGLENYVKDQKKKLGYPKDTSGQPDNYDKLEADTKKYYDQVSELDEGAKDDWLSQPATDQSKALIGKLSTLKPEDYPDLPQTNKVAEIYAKLESDQLDKKWAGTQLENEKKRALREAYATTLSEQEQFYLDASTADTKDMLASGELDGDTLARMVEYDDLIVELGGSAKISKEIRRAYGLNAAPTRTSSKSGSGSSKAKKASVPTVNFVNLGLNKLVNTRAPAIKYAPPKKPTVRANTQRAKARLKSL